MKLFIIILILILSGCKSDFSKYPKNTTSQIPEQNLTINKNLKIDIFFSKQSGSYYSKGVDFNITQDINDAKKSIYMGIYALTNKKITQALIDAKNRGVKVEVTTDDKSISTSKFQELIDAGIKVTDDKNPKALMHEKFLIIDDNILWSGSANYTVYAFYRNYENFVRIKSSKVSSIFTKEFNLLKNHNNQLFIGGKYKNIEIFFSPDSRFEDILINKIKIAKKRVYFLAYTFTSKKIANALIEANKRGVEVKGVVDEDESLNQESSKYNYLLENDINVKVDSNSYKLHSKVVIIDDDITITGSYNFTTQANLYNNEDSLIIKDKNITNFYTKEFNKIYFE